MTRQQSTSPTICSVGCKPPANGCLVVRVPNDGFPVALGVNDDWNSAVDWATALVRMRSREHLVLRSEGGKLVQAVSIFRAANGLVVKQEPEILSVYEGLHGRLKEGGRPPQRKQR